MRIFACAALAIFLALGAAAGEAGAERELDKKETDSALRGIAESFNGAPRISAKIVSQIEDLAGKRTEEGVMRLERPSRMLREFFKPSMKSWLLQGAELLEFSEGRKSVSVKDLSGAPKLLKQIQGAMMGNLADLAPSYELKIFQLSEVKRRSALKLVLDKKAGVSKRLYKRIEARIAPGELFFSEIRYIPEEGDEITEQFSEIKAVTEFDASDFKLPKDIERKIEKISE